MATQTQTATAPKAELTGEEKIQQLRELFADAPEVGKKALENVIEELTSQVSEPPPPIESAGRVGARLGKRSELTIIVPLVPGGAKRLRAFLQLLGGNLSPGATRSAPSTTCASCSSTTTRRCSSPLPSTATGTPISTTSSTKIPDYLDLMDSAWEGWPGIRSPEAKDYLVKHQITAEGWFVANPDLTLAEIAAAEAHRQGG